MFEQVRGLPTAQAILRAVRLKDSVRISHGKGVRIGRLFQTHHLPQDQIGLDRFVEAVSPLRRHFAQSLFHQRKLRLSAGICTLLQFLRQIRIASRQFHRCLQRPLHRRKIHAVLVVLCLFFFFLKTEDHGVHTEGKRPPEIRYHVPRHLLNEKGDLAGVIFIFVVYFLQFPHIGRPLHVILDSRDPLPRKFLVRHNVVEHGRRVTVSAESLHLKRRIDQRVRSRKGIPLRPGENGMFADG